MKMGWWWKKYLENNPIQPYLPDELVWEPDSARILAMPFCEMSEFVQNARMTEGCRPDDRGNRARIRACYLIDIAYDKFEDGTEV